MAALAANGRKFYDDDPLEREPTPIHVEKARVRRLSDVYDLLRNEFGRPGDRRPIAARDVNTVGEPLDGAWYEHRHYFRRMSSEQLAAGPGNEQPPAAGVWTVISAKAEGITPGFRIQDSAGQRYFLKFDPVEYPELTTGADVVVSKIFYALGYHVPENYIVRFAASRLQLRPGLTFRDRKGRRRPLTTGDVEGVLRSASRGNDGRLRAVASRELEGAPLGEFRFDGTRSDDPNDTVPHEQRRTLRGLQVFCAWVNHDDSRAINTLDTLIPARPAYIRHHLIDFGSTLGSASTGPNSPRGGSVELFDAREAALEFFTLGAYVPAWARVRYPDARAIGRFTADGFDPERWTPEYPNAAFENRQAEDVFWAAKQVAAFTDEDIRTVVRTGEYTDAATEAYLVRTLAQRRDAIRRAYLDRAALPLDRFRVVDGALRFDEVAAPTQRAPYTVSWSEFDNRTGRTSALPASGFGVPRSGSDYLAARIRAGNERCHVTVYLKQVARGSVIVGVDRVF